MKFIYSSKITTTFLLILFLMVCFWKKTNAQDCEYPSNKRYLEGNNISAIIRTNGSLFWDLSDAGFIAPNNNSQFDWTSIFAAGIVLGAIDTQGNLRTSYASSSYAAGPLNGSSEDCFNFDQLWEVTGSDIQQHISDFEDNGTIDNPIHNIYAYPGRQNPFFENANGFSLPDQSQGYAPFFDENGDGIYNPEDGDFPLPESVDKQTIPSHMIWGLFNDASPISASAPLNVDVQLTAWAMYCTDNQLLNNTVFTSHKIINTGTETLDSMFVSLYMDMDIGCGTDDYIGCIPDFNTFYGYNRDSTDGSSGCYCDGGLPTYCNEVPTQAITFLNQDLSSFVPISSFNCTSLPSNDQNFYNLLNGLYSDGTPMTVGGIGCQGTDVTKFAFPDNPNDPQGWSMLTTNNFPLSDFKSMANVSVGSLPPGASTTLDIGYSFHQDENYDHLEIVDEMYNQIPILQQLYDDRFQNNCSTNFCLEDCVWAGDANRDSIVTGLDFLQLALGMGQAGNARNTPPTWHPFQGENWNNSINGIDLKHTDCNGNGIVDDDDIAYPFIMFGNSYKTVPYEDTYPYGNEMSIVSHETNPIDSMTAGSFGWFKIEINQMDSIYGLTYVLEYDTSYFKNINMSFNNSIFANANNGSYKFSRELKEKGEIHFAQTKFNLENGISETGTINDFFIFTQNTDYQQVQTLIRLKNIVAILNDGTEIDYGCKDFVVNIFNSDGVGVILSNEDFAKENIEIFPNPTTHLLNVKFEKATTTLLSITDIYGKNMFQKQVNNSKQTTLSIEHLSSGIYFLKINRNEKKSIHRFVKI